MAGEEPAEVSEDVKFALIEEVRKRPLVYDTDLEEYHLVDKKNRAWTEIAEAVKLPDGPTARKVWDLLRVVFRRCHKKKLSSGRAASKEPRWRYYKQMAFLEAVSEPRPKSQSSIQMPAGREAAERKEAGSASENKAKPAKKYTGASPSSNKSRKRQADSPHDTDTFEKAIEKTTESATQRKTRNQLFGENLAADLDELPEHLQPIVRHEITELVFQRRQLWSFQPEGLDGAMSSTSSSVPASPRDADVKSEPLDT